MNRVSVTGTWGTQTYAYDDIYQLTGVDYPAGFPFSDMAYNYDPVGNRDSTVSGGTVDYQNNELNEYSSVGGTPFASDLRGNLTADGTHVYQYDLENRLTAIDGDISYTYNPFGLRTEKTLDEDATLYILDDQREIEEWEGGVLQRKFIYGVGIDEPLCMLQAAGSELYFYHFDALGSVQNLTDSTGATVATYRYDIYGAFNLTGSSHGNPYTFTGRRYDPENGIYYYRARYNSSSIGRFLQVDPIGYVSGPNLYIYVANNPIKYFDPLGTDTAGCDDPAGKIGIGDTACELECCAKHDECYDKNGCNASSWKETAWYIDMKSRCLFFPPPPPTGCNKCNIDVLNCLADCSKNPGYDDPDIPNYYCAKLDRYITICRSGCDFPDLPTAQDACKEQH